ncbi:hypothetical protein KR054_005541 [Drosophila jambulina]|nr:hypothetical protein KR054_005541 [Drosophila jambulina]
MSDNTAVNCALNVVLCGATGFGFIKIGSPAEHPYAFCACLIGFCHGLAGLLSSLVENDAVKKVQEVTTGVMEIIPLPLVNVDLYLPAESNNIALAHGMFVIPLGVSVILGLIQGKGEGEDLGTVDTLKILTVLGNVTSLAYLAMNDNSWSLAGMAFLAFMAKFGAEFSEANVVEGSAVPITYVSWSGFYILAAMAVSGQK